MKEQQCRLSKTLSAYMDGELPKNGMDRMRRHLADCPACRSHLKTLQSTRKLMMEMEDIIPSSDFDKRFLEKLSAVSAPAELQQTPQADIRPAPGIFHQLKTFLLSTWRPYALGTVAAGVLAFFILNVQDDAGRLEPEDIFLAENLEILQEYEILSDLEFFEYLEGIDALEKGS